MLARGVVVWGVVVPRQTAPNLNRRLLVPGPVALSPWPSALSPLLAVVPVPMPVGWVRLASAALVRWAGAKD